MKKRILSLMLSVVMIIILLPNMTVSAMTPQEGANWALAQIGKSIDVDGYYGAQCVDLIKKYCSDNWGWMPSGNAKTYSTIALPNSSWTRIKNTLEFIPQPGDIAVWTNGSYGHVAIIISANINSFVSVDQNWYNANGTVGSPAAKVTHNYSGFWGVIRPPFTTSSTDTNQAIHSSTSATIRNGIFTVKNIASGTYLNVWGGADSNGTPVTTYSYDDSTDQQFNFVHQGNGKYKIYPYCSSNGTNRVVDILRNNSAIAEGQKVDIYDPNDDTAQLFYIVPLNDGSYVFEIASKDGYVIAPPSGYAGSNTKNSQLTVQRYTGGSHQKWKFCNNNGGETHPIGSYSVDSYKVNTNGFNLTMRSGAGTGYAKVTSVPDNTSLNVSQVSGNWGYTTYNGYSGWVCLDFTIYAPKITSIKVKSMPRTTTYFVGESLDTTNIEIDVIYSNNSTKTIINGFATSYDFSAAGTKTVTITYEGKTTSFTVNVIEPTVIDVQIATNAEKTSYYIGDALDTTNLSLLATYNNGDTKIITSGFTTNYDFSSVGTKTVTVIYGGFSVSYDVTVQVKGNGNVVASSSKQKLYFGNEFSVKFDLKNAQNIYDGNFNVVYDNSVLEVVKTVVGASLKNSSSQINPDFAANKVRLTFAGTTPLINGNLLTVTFKVKSDKVTDTTVSIADINLYTASGDSATATSSNAIVEIDSYDYTITDIYFLNSSDQEIDKVPSNGNFYVGVEFNKNVSGTSRPNIIFALYDTSGKMIAMSPVQNRYAQGDGLTCETDFSIDSKYNVSKVKAFIWNSMTGLTPLSNIITN